MTFAATLPSVAELDMPLERDVFLGLLIRELSGTLQDLVGLEEASGFVSVVGQRVGDHINQSYRNALQMSSLSRQQLAEVLVDLKRRAPSSCSASSCRWHRCWSGPARWACRRCRRGR